MPDTKKCNRCHQVKPLTEFHKNRIRDDGLQRICKHCRKEVAQKARKEMVANRKYGDVFVEKKCCSRCNVVKPSSEFGKNITRPDGLQGYCKICRSEYSKIPNPKRKAYERQYKLDHKDKEYARRRKWRLEHPERTKAIMARYRASEYGKLDRHARSLKRRAIGTPEKEVVAEVVNEYGGLCPYCNQWIKKGHIDHIVPISANGTNGRNNLVYCCDSCNTSKGSKSLLEFMMYRSYQPGDLAELGNAMKDYA